MRDDPQNVIHMEAVRRTEAEGIRQGSKWLESYKKNTATIRGDLCVCGGIRDERTSLQCERGCKSVPPVAVARNHKEAQAVHFEALRRCDAAGIPRGSVDWTRAYARESVAALAALCGQCGNFRKETTTLECRNCKGPAALKQSATCAVTGAETGGAAKAPPVPLKGGNRAALVTTRPTTTRTTTTKPASTAKPKAGVAQRVKENVVRLFSGTQRSGDRAPGASRLQAFDSIIRELAGDFESGKKGPASRNTVARLVSLGVATKTAADIQIAWRNRATRVFGMAALRARAALIADIGGDAA